MKSKTSCFDKSVILKDITRFAPLWAIYLIGGIQVFLGLYGNMNSSQIARDLSEAIGTMSAINLIYAILCAQLLFGDMFKSRLCNALHAMPIRRETWFVSHLVSGLCFSLVPHLTVLPVLMAVCGELWFVPVLWVLGMTMGFVFFFGVAVFSMFCTGNRFAAVMVYMGLNFVSLIVRWFINILYEPYLTGIVLPEDPIYMLSPVIWLTDLGSGYGAENFMHFVRIDDEVLYVTQWGFRGLGTGWIYLAIVFAIGLVFLGVALLMYRKRALERAGDFIAVKSLRPVFSIMFTLCSGCIFTLFSSVLTYVVYADVYFMVAGLAVGYFVSQMMLQRTVRVFNGKAFLKLGILTALIVGSIVVTAVDPLGITGYVPDAGDVAYVEIDRSHEINEHSDQYMMVTEKNEIALVSQIHEQLLKEEADYGYTYCLRYKMKNGMTVYRRYLVTKDGTANKLLKELYSTPEKLLDYTDWETYIKSVTHIEIGGLDLKNFMDYADIHGALEAIRKDIEAGTVTDEGFRDYDDASYLNTIRIQNAQGVRYLAFYKDSSAFLQWAAQYPLLTDYLESPVY